MATDHTTTASGDRLKRIQNKSVRCGRGTACPYTSRVIRDGELIEFLILYVPVVEGREMNGLGIVAKHLHGMPRIVRQFGF